MDEAAYRIEARVERTLWWFKVRRRILALLIEELDPGLPGDALVLDVGCGTGANGSVLTAEGRTVVGVDRARPPLQLGRYGGGTDAAATCADAMALPFDDGRFDLAVALDVLEHLPDDRAAVTELARVLAPGGVIVVFVPAYEQLWGIQDTLSHHLRRYDRPELTSLFEGTALELERVTHFNALLAGPIFVARRILRVHRPRGLTSENELSSPALDAVLEGIFGLEVPLLGRANLPFGVSLAVVARKTDPRTTVASG